ncbi:hypothetical protein PT285_01915 [Lactobacillus sp. ESL0791]|uniref:hypothetical protein n=1 Tax=Lactobacillus sp. ESL0791 TaxID=2983234 RepID=UPI0023F73606|nr:hypothetical protein [Lactobacillus sp. ESL0791]MDF7638193.1 hypothetical protein [Lactobacillus sp. ESL0791]
MKINKHLTELSLVRHCKSTIKECSYDDDNHEYMFVSPKVAYNFDAIKNVMLREVYQNIPGKPSSSDALLEVAGKYVFIEFKNGKFNKFNVEKKMYDSAIILSELLNITMQEIRSSCYFVLVYNEGKNLVQSKNQGYVTDYAPELLNKNDSPSRDYIARRISKNAKKHFIKFGYEMFKGFLYADVYTSTKAEFQDWLDQEETDERR